MSPESKDASKDLWGGTSLVFQWLRTPHSQHRGPDSILGQGTRFCRQQLRQTQPKKKKKRTFGVFSGKKGEKKGRKEERSEEGREFPGSPLKGAQDHLTFRPAALRHLTLVSIQKQRGVWADCPAGHRASLGTPLSQEHPGSAPPLSISG